MYNGYSGVQGIGRIAAFVNERGEVDVVLTDQGQQALDDYAVPANLLQLPVDGIELMWVNVDGPARHDGHSRAPWHRNAAIVAKGMARAEKEFSNTPCGTCRQCCIIPYFNDTFDKPAQTPCPKLCTRGCSIYDTRPNTCSSYECMWLESQRGNDPWALRLRPDHLEGVIFQRNGERVEMLSRPREKPVHEEKVEVKRIIDSQKAMGRTVYWGDTERTL